ncbi:MAG: hypothetical protein WCO63_10430 [Bacteroidota bacterium]
MTQVTLSTDTAEEMQAILALIRRNKLKFKVVAIKEESTPTKKSVRKENWALPGTPMTDGEMKEQAELLSKQKGGITTEQLARKQEKWRKERLAGD